jgi:hypothetical protein
MIKVWQKEDEEALGEDKPADNNNNNNNNNSNNDNNDVGEGQARSISTSQSVESLPDGMGDMYSDAMRVNDAGNVTLSQAAKMKHLTYHERGVLQNIRRRITEARNVGFGDNDSLTPAGSVQRFPIYLEGDEEELSMSVISVV